MSSETLFDSGEQRAVRTGQAVFISWECRVWVAWAVSEEPPDVLDAMARLSDWVDESRVDSEGRPFETRVLVSMKGLIVEERAHCLAVSYNGHERFIPLATHDKQELLAAMEEAEAWFQTVVCPLLD